MSWFHCAILLAALAIPTLAADWAPFVEPNFPFYSSVLDARKVSTNNLTPRGLILNFTNDYRLCFDIDLARVAAIWQGPGVTHVSMSQGSYTPETWGKKAPEGQEKLPEPLGKISFIAPAFTDPRESGPDPREIGRGPLPSAEFKAIQQTATGVILEYAISNKLVRKNFDVQNTAILAGPEKPEDSPLGPPASLPARRWPQTLRTPLDRTIFHDAYKIDNFALPLDNPWRRNIRLADLAFFPDGRAAAVTFDGDVWLLDNLTTSQLTWRRYTSGLHEPLSIAIKENQIYVFDRNGIWRLLDTDINGEADRHEMFCHRFTQTAETREFANSMKLAPDGSFIIGKPGQTGSTVGRDSSKILRISPDGKTVTTLAEGFRQPFLGIHPKTGLLTASDQQGNYVPTTPLHVIRNPDYFGFRATILPLEKMTPKIAEPLVWIPHAINASGANQVWLSDSGMGPLNNTLIHVGYYRSELFNVLWNGGQNAAIVSFTRDLQFAPLNAAVHPIDGSLYVIGFQLWGGSAPQISGLARITYTGAETGIPREIQPTREGVLIQFNTQVADTTVRPENFSAERWNYRRSHEYGSPHFKLDGTKGQETLFASSAYLSQDRRSVFIGLPDMQPTHTLRIGWSLKSQTGKPLQNNAYLTPRNLQPFTPENQNFGKIKIDLTPRTAPATADTTPITVEEGRRLAELMGCAACHSADGSSQGKVGPTWKGLANHKVQLADNTTIIADEPYLRESILTPPAKVVKGFDKSDTGMPSYEGVITDPQLQALILYIQSLR